MNLTPYTTTQLNITWDTEMAKNNYAAICTENGEEYTDEGFLEYLASNFLEWIRESSDKGILREINLFNSEGDDLTEW